MWNVQKGWKSESVWWRDRVQLLHEREQHQNALRLRDEENALWKHYLVEHDGVEAEFSMKQTNVFKKVFFSFIVGRQI